MNKKEGVRIFVWLFVIALALSQMVLAFEISVTYPQGGEVITTEYMYINWSASYDPEATVLIDLYYDLDNISTNGRTLIVENVDLEENSYVWHLMGVPSGELYLSAVLTVQEPFEIVTAYSEGPITRVHFDKDYISLDYDVEVNQNNISNFEISKPLLGDFIRGVSAVKFNFSNKDSYQFVEITYTPTSNEDNNTYLVENNLFLKNDELCNWTLEVVECIYKWDVSQIKEQNYIYSIHRDFVNIEFKIRDADSDHLSISIYNSTSSETLGTGN